jgi:two-component sensor histidine kinase/CHASE3 domain sensor protein
MQELQEASQYQSRALLLAVGMSLMLLIGAGVLTWRVSGASIEAEQWVAHTLEVKQSIAELINAVNAAESAQRGYLLTGDDALLEPYRTLRRTMPDRLAKLHKLVRDNPRQLARLEELTPVLLQRVDVIDRTLALSSQGQHVVAVDIMRVEGVPLMKEVRSLVEELDAIEGELLMQRQKVAADARRQFLIASTAMLVACGVLAVFSLLTARRYAKISEASRRRLAQHNVELERRVDERTADHARAAELAHRERDRAEALLTDVNHRIGNNLALVSSFLTMQERLVRSPDAARALDAARARVQAIASAHRKLRLGADFATVRANEVLGAVLEDIAAGLPPGDLIRINCRVDALEINARDAVSLGVLTSELVMNAVKHAFSPVQPGRVDVVLSKVGVAAPFLEVSDDGAGWHEEYAQDGNGLGAKIIDMVARQFGGQAQRTARQLAPDRPERPGTRVHIDLTRLQFIQS